MKEQVEQIVIQKFLDGVISQEFKDVYLSELSDCKDDELKELIEKPYMILYILYRHQYFLKLLELALEEFFKENGRYPNKKETMKGVANSKKRMATQEFARDVLWSLHNSLSPDEASKFDAGYKSYQEGVKGRDLYTFEIVRLIDKIKTESNLK